MRVGIEIGGTFTDLVCVTQDGTRIAKVPSTPRRPDEGAFAALRSVDIAFARIGELVHGSTVATNAVLERKGARIALLVTGGFRDILELRRQDRLRIYDLYYQKPPSLVPRSDVLEVPERILADGTVERALDLAGFEPALRAFLGRGAFGGVAICLLNAFVDPAHERAVAAAVRRAAPGLTVTLSSEVCREFREYERASTTVLSAYVQPVLDAYLSRIEARLAEGGFGGRFSMMQSNGGCVPAEAMRRNAVAALVSGPAAGVAGAIRQAGLSGVADIITLDIGGTSADVCLIEKGRPGLTRETQIEGAPVMTPMLDITTVGAGGGSLAWVDEGGLLRVGPRSAGADPGPACYGRGGTLPTLTDANLLCGRLPAGKTLAGGLVLDEAAAHAAYAPLAETLGLSVQATAESVIRIAVANVVGAIRLVSTRRGRDPRDYALFAFGGAGPLHAAEVADELGMDRVIVPPGAGVLSAYGLLAADHSLFASLTRRCRVDAQSGDAVRQAIGALRTELDAKRRELGLDDAGRLDIALEMRFVGQAFEIVVDLPADAVPTLTQAGLLERFAEAHERIYRQRPDMAARAVEIVSWRVGMHVPQPEVPGLAREGPPIARSGPAVIEDATATVWVPAGWHAETDAAGNLMLRRRA